LGERASNLFGVLLSLTFFSVLLAVMLVAVSILPDGPTLAPPTLPGETRSGPVRTPQPVTLGELGLAPAPALAPAGAGAGLASVTFTTGVIPPPAGPSAPGGGVLAGPDRGPTRGPGLGPDDGFRRPGSTRTDVPGGGLGRLKKKGESGAPKRGPAFLRCEEESSSSKTKAKGRCDGPGDPGGSGNGGGRGKGSGKGGSSGSGAVGPGHGGSSSGGHGLGLGHVKAKGNGHGNGPGKGHPKFAG
jgi:hypothetical protein